MNNGNGDGPLTNLGDDIMQGVDDLATDIGLDGSQNGVDNAGGTGTGNGAGNTTGMGE